MFKELFTEGIDPFSRGMEADAKRAGLDMSHTSPESATFYFDNDDVSVVVRNKKYKIQKNKASDKDIKKIKDFLGDWDVVTEAQKINLFTGTNQEVQTKMDALFAYDEKNNYETQVAEITSYTKDYRTYYITSENPAGYKKHKKIIDKIIKGK